MGVLLLHHIDVRCNHSKCTKEWQATIDKNVALKNMQIGKLYLIPLPISEGNLKSLSEEVRLRIPLLQHYFVENIRTARRFIKAIHPDAVIDTIQFSIVNNKETTDVALLKTWLRQGIDVGIMSESGCPGIADPGADLVACAQQMQAPVIPLVGPSSILLSLMASGLNGQRFCFYGYLPIKEPERSKEIKQLEQQSRKMHQTQLFIETPYRNNTLLADLIKNCAEQTRICIAYDITGAQQHIATKTVKQWKGALPHLGKEPCVFLMLA